MARQVQMMLLNLGIVATLNQKSKVRDNHYRPIYRITMMGSALRAFSKVGFGLTRKQQLLKSHIQKMERVNTNIDLLPYIGLLVERSWRTLSERKLSTGNLAKVIDKVRRRSRISRQTLSEYVSYVKNLSVNVPHLQY